MLSTSVLSSILDPDVPVWATLATQVTLEIYYIDITLIYNMIFIYSGVLTHTCTLSSRQAEGPGDEFEATMSYFGDSVSRNKTKL